MTRWERFGYRDLTYSCWHRSLPDHHAMIDLDGVKFCRRCHAILCLVETARDVGQADKRTTVLKALAKATGTVALLVMWTWDAESRCACGAHSAIASLRVRRVYPDPSPLTRSRQPSWQPGSKSCAGSIRRPAEQSKHRRAMRIE